MIVSRRKKLQALNPNGWLQGIVIDGGVARVIDVDIEHLAFSDVPDIWITYLAVEGDDDQKHDRYRITVEVVNVGEVLVTLDACDFFAYNTGPSRGQAVFLRKDKVS